jgi:hypothetical protein
VTPGGTASVGVTHNGNDVTLGANGTLNFGSGSDLNIALNGTAVDTQYDQLGLVGRVNLTGVDLVPLIGFSPAVGSMFVIVNNDGSADPVIGTFNGLPEGKVFSVVKGAFSATFQISYQGGDGNDVVLTALSATNAEVQGTPGADAFVVTLNGDNVEVSLHGNVILSTPLSPVTTLTIDGLAGPSVLTIDSGAGDPFPSGGITFEGTGSLSLGSGGNLAVPINGTTPGQPGGYNQLTISGNVDLAGVNLVLAGTYTPAVGDQFTIVSNSLATGQTTGSFAGLPEGTVFNPAAGVVNAAFVISYHGGDGNDVVLTVVNTAPSFLKGANQDTSDESPAQSIPGWATGMSAGPPNEAGQNLTFQVSVPVAQQSLFAMLPQVDATGTLAFTPAPNAFGSVQISVTLLDDGGTASGGSDASAPQVFTITITKPHPWHNALYALDVTNSQANGTDGIVAAGDALGIINYINAHGAGQIPTDAASGQPYLDTWNSTTNTYAGDNFIAPADALAVTNFINQFGNGQPGPAGEGEGEATPANQPDHNLLSSDLIALLALDIAAAGSPRRRLRLN